MNYTICDSNEPTRKKFAVLLKSLVSKSKEPFQIREIESGMMMIDDILQNGAHDVCFIRSDMSGLTGIEIMNIIRRYRQNLYCVLYSGDERYALQAWENMADSYFMLPFDKNQLIKILEHSKSYFLKNDCACIRIKRKDGWYHIRLRNIINMESHAHKVVLNLTDHNNVETYGKLDSFEKEIQEDHRFVRIHKSTIVNGSYISRFSATEVELTNGQIYPISRTLHKKAQLQYDQYIETYGNFKHGG